MKGNALVLIYPCPSAFPSVANMNFCYLQLPNRPFYNANMTETIMVNFDGGSRGNPGPAGIGVVLAAEDGTPLITRGKFIGVATNNVAEYTALIFGLREAAKLGASKILVRGDSELVIRQMRGEYRVKNPALKHLFEQAQALLGDFKSVKLEHNLRDQNSLADRLANRAMDKRADVDDAGESEPVPPQGAWRRVSCSHCGCQIEVKVPPKATAKGNFICPCGNPMS
jgi:ribonuclease HI